MILPLLACTCPTFDETEIVAADESATERVTDEVSLALADFAAWTGDAGVCVPEIRVQADIPEPAKWRGTWVVGGQYRGKHAAILLDADSDALVWQRTVHELCHASDRIEGHSDAMDWPASEGSTPLDGEPAAREDFAAACQSGPPDVTLDAAVVDRCGGDPTYDAGDYYLADVVFPDAPRPVLADDVTPATITRRAWTGVPADASIEDVMAVDDGVGLLLVEPDDKPGQERLVLQVWDATLTVVTDEVVLASGADAVGARFVRADTGVNLYSYVRGDGGTASSSILEMDLDGGSPLQHAVGEVVSTDVVSDGVAYGLRDDGFVATPLGGASEALALPWEVFGWTVEPWAIWPEADGFAFYAAQGLGRYDAATRAWSLEAAPAGADARIDLVDGRSVVRAESRLLLYEAGAYSFAGDPCATPDTDWADDLVVGLGDRILAFSPGTAARGPRYVTETVLGAD